MESPSVVQGYEQDSFNAEEKPNTTRANGGRVHERSSGQVHTNGIAHVNGLSENHQHHESTTEPPIPIAICGMACRLPGGVSTPQELWEFIIAKKSARGKVPKSRYNIDTYYSLNVKPGSISTEYGYFLDESIDLGALDTSFFSLPRTEVERADPQQRLMLEIARECFEDAGLMDWKGRMIGCYIGNFGEDWIEMFSKETQQWGMHRIVGTGDFVISNRLSYEFDIRGPSMTIRTGCSAALVCLNEACTAIARGDCEGALVGGVNIILAPSMTAAMTEQGILSKDGACKSFSAEANGYARGEAATAIYIKPLADAIRDGNPIRAVIRSTSHNVDGKTPGLSQPSTDAQEALIRRAYQLANISDFSQTAMVECHGTGTPTGDPIEARAVARVFGEKGIYIGSVKPNMGHTEGASGLVSLIKMVKALEHRTIPPNILFKTPNPNIPFKEAKLTVPVEPTAWPEDRLERVSINSFGVGGANAHVIIESAVAFNASSSARRTDAKTPQILLFTAKTAKSLTRLTKNYQKWVEENQEKVEDLAYTLAMRREHWAHRAFGIAMNGVVDSVSPPATLKSGPDPKIIMVFTGQGAQWPQMGHELMQKNQTFKATLASLDRHLQNITRKSSGGYSIQQELSKPPKQSRVGSAEISQPLCTAIQIGLVDVLKSLGIIPAAVVGHSSGEIAAAYASGGLTAEEAIVAAHNRGEVTTKQERQGAMAAIGLSWDETDSYLIPGVTLACHNSPKSVTISGDIDAVKAVVANIKKAQPDILARLLQVDKAYHSYHMWEIGEHYRSQIKDNIVGNDPRVPFFSSVTGEILNGQRRLGPDYWQENLESPVRFCEAVTNILKHDVGQKNPVFLEVGPHSALAGPLRQIFTSQAVSAPYVATMTRNRNSIESLLTAIGKLHSLYVPFDLAPLFIGGSCLPDLPRYPWNHEKSYWYEPRISKEWRERKFPYHDLLGVKSPESSDIQPVWRNQFHLTNVPWVRDHKVGEDIVFPFAGYIALAGEAIRQVTQNSDMAGFTVRNITVTLALVLAEGKPTEILTSFRPQRLTDSLNSSWWEFTVTSHNGHVWTKHCSGEVMPVLSDHETPQLSGPETLPRKVDSGKWYDNMRQHGLNLGPCFQTLEAIETSTDSSNRAIGKVANGRQGDESNYFIHPTVIDGTIQLLGAAAVSGHIYQTSNWLPTRMDEFTVLRCSTDMVSHVHAKLSSNRSVMGSGHCIAEGKTVIAAKSMTMSLAEGALSDHNHDSHASARYHWGRDINFRPVRELIRPPPSREEILPLLNELGQLCLLHSQRRLEAVETSMPHIQKYKRWLTSEMRSSIVNLASFTKSLDNPSLVARIERLVATLSATPAAAAAAAIEQVYTRISQSQSADQSFDAILPTDTLDAMSGFVNDFDFSGFLQCLSHWKPNMQILEISTGRSSSAADFIQSITRPSGQVLCSKYTLTSLGFVDGKDQKRIFPNLEYITLDICEDLSAQGFDGREYDLVIMPADISRSADDLRKALTNVRELLHRDGRFLWQNVIPSTWMSYVLGVLPSSWPDHTDQPSAMPLQPGLGIADLKSLLHDTGFDEPEGMEGIVLDAHGRHQLTAAVVAMIRAAKKPSNKNITVLYSTRTAVVKGFLESLGQQGYNTTNCTLYDAPPAGQDIISLLDVDGPFFYGIDIDRFQAFKRLLLGLKDAGVLWVTPPCSINARDPRYAQVLGLARVIRSEMLADFGTCEVEDFDSHHSIISVFKSFQDRREDEIMHSDFEWAVKDGQVYIGRYYPFALDDELLVTHPGNNAQLDVEKPGRINSLRWVQQPREDLQMNEVEVQVHSAGLNFRDVLVALGVVELPIRQFGLEAAGIITRVGPNVNPDNLKVGDRVCCLKKQAYSAYIITPTTFCTRIPDTISFDEAASMLMPYVTALHSLVNVGRLVRGQSVLVHSACGGVGLAAIQVCRLYGANIFATVSSDDKVRFLMDNFAIPRNHIFDSRSKQFVDGIMQETHGQGVDLIMNSLSGELLHETWKCVAEFGTLIEIGKRDLIGGGKLDLKPFLANRSYCCIDIDQLWKKPTLLRNLILSTVDYCAQGLTTPVRPVNIFPASQTQDAFRFMQKGRHIGRVGVAIPHPGGPIDATFDTVKQMQPIAFKKNASYLLIGGLGGLGRSIATWMTENGAREIIFLSRSAGEGKTDSTFVAELQSMGCTVRTVKGDVTVAEDVARAMSEAAVPPKGIIQMSMILRDENFTNMTFDQWIEANSPKVKGTWNLHDIAESTKLDLDFFVLFSSLSGIIGQPGQANYASGNTFLDAFCQFRNQKGLPASVVDIGAVEGVGFISENAGLMNKMKNTGFKPVKEKEFLDAMAVAMMVHARPPQMERNSIEYVHANTFVIGLGSSIPLSSPNNRAVWKRDRRMAAYHAASGDNRDLLSSNDTLKTFITGAKTDPSILKTAEASKTLALEIGKKLFDLLLKPQEDINTSSSLVDLGLDSLVALELRAWWKLVFSFDITVIEMMGMGSLDALGQHAVDGLLADSPQEGKQ